MTTLLNSLEFVIVPFVNPDGYDVSELTCASHFTHLIMSHPPHIMVYSPHHHATHHLTHLIVMLPTSLSCHSPHHHTISLMQYTWTNDRLWRKNRRKDIICYGVDLNRNYNIKWGGVSGNNGYIEVNLMVSGVSNSCCGCYVGVKDVR